MALGSSAPEILLSVIETVTNLGGCPGELGPSTIVGSAAFNLLVISGVSIYAVNDKNEANPDWDDDLKSQGIKKIKDMGVFSITAFFSIFAYVWLFIVLYDQQVELWEAWLTFIFFFVLIIFAYCADIKGSGGDDEEPLNDMEDGIPVVEFTPMEIYKQLVAEKKGEASKDPAEVEKRQQMKDFLKASFKTDQIERINKDELKKALEGDHMLGRMKYRRQVGNFIGGKRIQVQKGEVLKQELAQAEHIDEKQKHPLYGFKCLHYSVSEASGSIMIHIINKTGEAGKVRVKTIDQEAKAGDDYEAVDEILDFKQGEL